MGVVASYHAVSFHSSSVQPIFTAASSLLVSVQKSKENVTAVIPISPKPPHPKPIHTNSITRKRYPTIIDTITGISGCEGMVA